MKNERALSRAKLVSLNDGDLTVYMEEHLHYDCCRGDRGESPVRNMVCCYNSSIVAAALATSLLGAFTSTQLMHQARGARVPAIIGGFILPSVIKGFVWSIARTNMHFMGVKVLEIPGGSVVLNPA